MADAILSVELGAAGRPTLSFLIEKAIRQLRAEGKYPSLNLPAKTAKPAAPIRGCLQGVPEDAILDTAASERDSLKLNMLRSFRPLPFQHAWTFYHDKHSSTANHESRLTVMMEEIASIKLFWEVFNQFPIQALRTKDSVRFFKRGVKPVWDDPRNIAGGSWTFVVPKAQSLGVWKETLLLAVGEQFADIIQPGDDLCGVSISVGSFNTDEITIWNRNGTNGDTINGILSVMLDKTSPDLKLKDASWSYKLHSERAGFQQAIARAKWVGFSRGASI